MFFERSLTVNWCREFAVNLAIVLKAAVTFALFDNDFRLPLVITYTWVRQIRIHTYFICLPEDVYMIRVQTFGLCKRTYGDDDDDDDDDAAAELIIICSIISSRLEIAANNTSQ